MLWFVTSTTGETPDCALRIEKQALRKEMALASGL